LLVKGAGAALALGDQMKGMTSGMRLQLGSFMEEARAEKEQTLLSDGAQSIKAGFEEGMEKVKETGRNAEDTFKNIFDDVNPQEEQRTVTHYNVLNDQAVRNKLQEIEKQLH
jgi:hypothetical protein